MGSPSTESSRTLSGARALIIGPRTRADPMYSNIYRSAIACGIDARWADSRLGVLPTDASWRPTHVVVGGQQIRTQDEPDGFRVDGRDGVKIVAIWTDTRYLWVPSMIAARDYAADLHVALDGEWTVPKPGKPALGLWTPIDMETFHKSSRELPEAGIFFRGAITPARAEALKALHAAGVPTYPANGAQAEQRMPLEAYAGWLRGCCGAVNTPEGKVEGSLGPQLKGRPIEVLMSGTVLLERLPSPVSDYLKDGRDFLGWSTPEELVAAARRCVARGRDVIDIAMCGHQAAKSVFCPSDWWRRVLAAA